MEFRRLGASGLKVSEITHCTLLYHKDPTPDEQVLACMRAALEAGVTTFDTADAYGPFRSERLLGKVVAENTRDSLVLCTKVCLPTGWGPNDRGLSRKHVLAAIDGSLSRLGTDYVDLYTAHRFDADTPLEETLSAFADLVRAGKVRYVGVSEWTADQIRQAARLARDLRLPLVFDQPQYSMLWRVPEEQVTQACTESGMGLMTWYTTAQGVLTGKYAAGSLPPAGSRATAALGGRAEFLRSWMAPRVLERVARLRPLAGQAGLTMAQLAVAWVLQRPGVSSAVVGASRPEQVHENAKAAGVRLEEALMAAVDEVLDPVVTRDSRLQD